MIEERGEVVAVENGVAWVETDRKSACESCAVSHGCGTATLSKAFTRKRSRVRVVNSLHATVGDRVQLGLKEDALVKGSFAVYAVPLVALFAGALLGEWLTQQLWQGESELLTIVMALAGLGGSTLWLRYFTRHIRYDGAYQPVMLRKEK
ncbi:MAG: sigma-E factor negative regulatory protein RseC [Halothiobacillaceae bacterium]|nr:MAG: sigma-E factor negative regulatory protein RseC [Halothiobacillaceae bacterium]